jgi:endonuclease/exonuclease/phosphatase family metal-dependent hydrolase
MSQASPIVIEDDSPPRRKTSASAAAARAAAARAAATATAATSSSSTSSPSLPPGAATQEAQAVSTSSSLAASANDLLKFSVLTWNVAECLPAAVAPPTWTKELSRAEILRKIVGLNADVVCLQEAPSIDFAIGDEYQLLGSTPSHCGFVQLHVKAPIKALVRQLRACGPAIIADLQSEGLKFSIASMHLQPFAGGGAKRLQQLEEMQQASQESFVFAGDANIRTEEAVQYAAGGLVRDAHAVFQRSRPFTWDTYKNKYHGDDPTRQYTSNYDRIWTAGHLIPTSCRVCCSEAASASPGHYLSDHFGLFAHVVLSAQRPPDPPGPTKLVAPAPPRDRRPRLGR